MKPINRCLAAAATALVLMAGGAPAAPDPGTPVPGTIQVSVDASNVGQGVFMVHQQLPTRPGKLRLLYPQWLPGWHGPVGKPEQIAGLMARVGGQRLAWRRSADDPWAFEIEVPPGATAVDLHYQWLAPTKATDMPSPAPLTRDQLGVSWPGLLLYPAGAAQSAITVRARVKLPAAWGWGSALRAVSEKDGWIEFEPATLEALLDSPLWAGAHYRRFEMDGSGAAQPAVLHLFAERDAKAPADAQIAAHRRLFEQAERLFGWRPWRHFDVLLADGKALSFGGLEHHESVEIASNGRYFDDWAMVAQARDLVPHELVHAWNGKAFRPAELWAADMNTATQNDLLWVYEGLTEYWGWVLATRAGLVTPEQMQRLLVRGAAYHAELPGREWRSLQDTTLDPQQRTASASPWPDWTRGYDYYTEASLLIWLDADTLIRERSGNARSLDDFAREFFVARPAGSSATAVQRYGFDDVVAALQRVQPHDWAGFLRERLDRTGPSVPVDGLARAGWRVAWADARSPLDLASLDPEKPVLNLYYSLGISVGKEGAVTSVGWGSAAFRAGLATSDVVLAVQGQAYKPELLEAALRNNRDGARPLELLLRRGDDFRSLTLDVRGGPRQPRPARIEGTADRLADILKPR